MRGLSGENIHPFIQASIHASVRMTVTVASAKTVKMRHIECDGSADDRYSFVTEHETAHKRYMNTSQTSMSVHLYHVSSQLLFSFSKVTGLLSSAVFPLSFRQFQHRAHSPAGEESLQRVPSAVGGGGLWRGIQGGHDSHRSTELV